MGSDQASNPSYNNNLYPQEFQIKLYQAFIFSIPILFSIMLFLLFYLFYLKRRASDLSQTELPITLTSNQASTFPAPASHVGIKGDLRDNLLVVPFDEELRAKDSQCCVCLGEFELKQELEQVPYCKHVFHPDCIRDWLQKNATCPLCRCHVITPSTQQPRHQEGSGDDDHHSVQGLAAGDFSRDEEHVLHIELLTVSPDGQEIVRLRD